MVSFVSRELVQPFSPDVFLQDEAAFASYAEIINELWSKGGAPGCPLGITLGHNMVLTRKVPVALGLDSALLREHLNWEVEQSLVSPLSHYIMDYQRLPFTSSGGHPIYLLVLLRKIILSRLQTLFSQMNVQLADLDVDIFSLIRLIVATENVGPDDLLALIDVEAAKLTVVLVHARDFYHKHVIILNDFRKSQKSQRPADIAALLLKELKRLVFGHRLGGDLDALSKIILTGEGVTQDFQESVAALTDIPVDLLNPFTRLNIMPSVAHIAQSESSARHFGAAVGLAFKQKAISVK